MYLLKIDISNEQNNEIYPQVSHMGLDYNFAAPNAVGSIVSNEPLSFEPNLKSFHLDPDTNLTDIVSQAFVYTQGLMVSEPFYQAIKSCALQPHHAYPAEVVHHNTSHPYFWLHVTERLEPFLDFERSEFVEKNIAEPFTPVRLSNPAELKEKCKSIVQTISGTLTARKLCFLPGVPAYDMFFLDLVPRLIFVSSSMRDLLLTRRFTGFDITPTTIDTCFG